MQATRPAVRSPLCRTSRRGFTLVELMVVVAVISVLVVMAVPSYQRALEQFRADIAAANLRAVWSAERLYWLDYQAYTADLAGLRTAGLVDPEILLSTTGYAYTITSADNNSFQAAATRTGSAAGAGQYTIDETGTISGTVQAPGGAGITPGFQ